MTHSARWDLVHTAAGWHARFIARNGKIVASTEVYKRREGAIRAVRVVQFDSPGVELRVVDERADAH